MVYIKPDVYYTTRPPLMEQQNKLPDFVSFVNNQGPGKGALPKIITTTLTALIYIILGIHSTFSQTNQQYGLDSIWNVWNDRSQADTQRLQAIQDIAWKGYLYSYPDSAFHYAQLGYDFAESKKDKFYMSLLLKTQGESWLNRSDYSTALDYFEQSLKIAYEIDAKKRIGITLDAIGRVYYRQGISDSALNYYNRSLEIKKVAGDKKGIAKTLNNIGMIHYQEGNIAAAIENFSRSLSVKEELGDKRGAATTLNNIGVIYSNQKDYVQSFKYHTQSLEISKELGDKYGIAVSLHNIGNIYRHQKDYINALDHYNRSLKIRKNIGYKYGVAANLNNIGLVNMEQGKLNSALDYFTRCLAILKELGDKDGIAESMSNIGWVYFLKNDYPKAITSSDSALSIAQDIRDRATIKNASRTLYEAYKAIGRYKIALEKYELFIAARDSLDSEENQKEVIRQKYKYDYEKQAIEDSVAYDQMQKVQEAKLEKSKSQQYALIIGLLIVVAIMMIIIRSRKKQMRLKNEITSAFHKLNISQIELEKLSKAIEQTSTTVVITDNNGKIEYVNPHFTAVTGYTAEEAMDQNPGILKSGEMPDAFYKELWETITAGNIWQGELINKRKNGEIYSESASISPIKNEQGVITHYVAVKEDITELKHVNEELKKAKVTAEAATQAKSDFLANMSHEIRTPMNAIIGMSHLAQKTELSPKQKDYIDKIERSAQSLLGIINDILDFSKIEAGKLSIEQTEFDLEQLLDSVSNLITLKAQQKGLEIVFSIEKDVPMNLLGDPLRIGQIITNLCSNAVKFTENGEIVITTKLASKTDDTYKLQFSVKDTGIGLTEEQKNKLFKAFSQADASTTRKYGGTGLGLTISKNLVEMMGGEIWVESEYGKGSTFSFTVILKKSSEERFREVKPSFDLRKMKVLVCDDNETSRNLLREALESFTFEVFTASSAEEAIKELKLAVDNPYELILMDRKMPHIDGLKASEMILNDPEIPKIPLIIMVTAYAREEVIKKAEKLDLSAILVKPVSYSLLFNTIMSAFGKTTKRESRFENKGTMNKNELKQIAGTNVLLVEDNEINQQVATELLEGVGLNVDVADNGEIALALIKTSGVPSKYQLVLMDLQMPVMDGIHATQEIRKLIDYKTLPIIAMTADAMAGVREKCLEAGMMDMVTKPIDPDKVFATVLRWVLKSEGIKIDRLKDEKKNEQYEIPNIPGLNVSLALKRVNQNKKLYLNILEKFYNENQQTLDQINSKFKESDFETAHRLTHTLKGVSGNIGAEKIQTLSEKLESIITDKNHDKFPPAMLELKEAIGELFDQIFSNMKPENKKESRVLNLLLTNEILPELENQLNNKNPKAKESLDKLEQAGMDNPLFQKLKSSINSYNFREASKILIELKKQQNL